MAVGAYFAGIAIALCTTFMSALGLALQKYSHLKHEKRVHSSSQVPGRRFSTYRDPTWLIGIGLMIASSLLSLAVFALVGQAVASTFASITLIWTAIFAYFLLHERVTRIDLLSTTLLLIGAIITVTFGAQRNPDSRQAFLGVPQIQSYFRTDRVYIFSAIVGAIVIGAISFVYYVDHRSNPSKHDWLFYSTAWWRPFLAGIFSATTGICSKGFTSIISATGKNGNGGQNFGNATFWLFLACLPLSLICQISYLNSGLRHFDASLIVPIYQSLIVVLGVVFGFIYWDEGAQLGPNIAGFIVGIVIIIGGLSLLLFKSRTTPLSTLSSLLNLLFDLRYQQEMIRKTVSDGYLIPSVNMPIPPFNDPLITHYYGHRKSHYRTVEPLFRGRGRVLVEPNAADRRWHILPEFFILRLRLARDITGRDILTFIELKKPRKQGNTANEENRGTTTIDNPAVGSTVNGGSSGTGRTTTEAIPVPALPTKTARNSSIPSKIALFFHRFGRKTKPSSLAIPASAAVSLRTSLPVPNLLVDLYLPMQIAPLSEPLKDTRYQRVMHAFTESHNVLRIAPPLPLATNVVNKIAVLQQRSVSTVAPVPSPESTVSTVPPSPNLSPPPGTVPTASPLLFPTQPIYRSSYSMRTLYRPESTRILPLTPEGTPTVNLPKLQRMVSASIAEGKRTLPPSVTGVTTTAVSIRPFLALSEGTVESPSVTENAPPVAITRETLRTPPPSTIATSPLPSAGKVIRRQPLSVRFFRQMEFETVPSVAPRRAVENDGFPGGIFILPPPNLPLTIASPPLVPPPSTPLIVPETVTGTTTVDILPEESNVSPIRDRIPSVSPFPSPNSTIPHSSPPQTTVPTVTTIIPSPTVAEVSPVPTEIELVSLAAPQPSLPSVSSGRRLTIAEDSFEPLPVASPTVPIMPDSMRMGVGVVPSGFSLPVASGSAGIITVDPRLLVAMLRAPKVTFRYEPTDTIENLPSTERYTIPPYQRNPVTIVPSLPSSSVPTDAALPLSVNATSDALNNE